MSIDSGVNWTDSAVNPTGGCDGCELHRSGYNVCYAASLTKRFRGSNPGLARNFDVVELFPDRMSAAANWPELRGKRRCGWPWLDGLPRHTFIGDMADALSDAVTFGYLAEEVFANVASEKGQRHIWIWLTKRPKRMAELSDWLSVRGTPWPVNLIAGTSVTTQASVSRVKELQDVGDDSTIRLVSLEPEWERVDLSSVIDGIDWLIQGGQSGKADHPFDVAWADECRSLCLQHGVPYFLKPLGLVAVENGQRLAHLDRSGEDWTLWPARLRIRQMAVDAAGQRLHRHRQYRRGH
jgi:protein gp37